jgi:hypothetical protein
VIQSCQSFLGAKYQKGKIILNYHELYQVFIKYTTIFHCKNLQNLPKFGFLLENKPSGNNYKTSLKVSATQKVFIEYSALIWIFLEYTTLYIRARTCEQRRVTRWGEFSPMGDCLLCHIFVHKVQK